MRNLLYYTYLFAAVLFIIGIVEARRSHKSWLLYLYLLPAVVMAVGTVLFLNENIGENVALQRFNLSGLTLVAYVSGVLILVGGIFWAWRRRFFPYGLLLCLAVLQIIFYFLLRIYFAR